MTLKRVFLLLIISVTAMSAAFFLLCYQFDNKYTHAGPQAENGVFVLNEALLEAHPAVFLTYGWEIYRDRLLAPGDFTAEPPPPDEIVYIGQYGGFEGADIARSPHGCATYRMNILIPPEPALYTLELPEIFSAYRLYINGVLAEQFGNPDPAAYRPQTGNATVSVLAKNRIELIIAASDYSHMYSGMVYPPAFGVSEAVSRMLQTRLTLRVALCSIALALAVFSLITAVFLKIDRDMLLFGLMCFCYVGYTCYPIVKTIARGGIAWYSFENVCFCAMFLLVVLLQRHITGDKSALSKVFSVICAVVSCCAALRAVLPSGDLRLLAAYSALIGLYKWGVAAYLTISMARFAFKDMHSGYTMLGGVVVFDCALVMDRLLPLFEPMHLGWFIETAGAALVFSVGVVLGQGIVRQYRERLELANSIRIAETQIALQGEEFLRITQSIEQTKAARHDLRHQLAVMKGFLIAGDIGGAQAYVDALNTSIPALFEQTLCENFAVNAIALHYLAIAQNEGVNTALTFDIPQQPGRIQDNDLCVIIGNMLENAIEACRYVSAKQRFIKLNTHVQHDYLSIVMDNSFDGTHTASGGAFLSRKRGGAGIGLSSISMIAEKYDGSASFQTEGNVFLSSVVMLMLGSGSEASEEASVMQSPL